MQSVAYSSKSLTPTELRYARIEKERLAIVEAFNKFDQWLLGRSNVCITVHVDHQPLQSIFQKDLATAPKRLQKMMLFLQWDAVLWPKMSKDVIELCYSCLTCARHLRDWTQVLPGHCGLLWVWPVPEHLILHCVWTKISTKLRPLYASVARAIILVCVCYVNLPKFKGRVHKALEKFENAKITSHSEFVFEDWLKQGNHMITSTQKRKTNVFKFLRFEESVRKAPFWWQISVGR